MANTIRVKRSSTPSATPTTAQLSLGEIAINTWDGKLFIAKNNGTASIVEIGAGGGGGGSGISSLNALTDSTQTFATGTSGTNFAVSSSAGVHTFNLPDASLTARGAVTTAAQSFKGTKTIQSDAAGNKALICKAASGQTANIWETQDSSGNVQTYVNSGGFFNTYLGFVNATYIGYRNSYRSVYVGERAGESNAANSTDNVAVGFEALRYNTTGNESCAIGKSALGAANSTAQRNCALGFSAGQLITSGSYNVFKGYLSGSTMTTGSYNVLLGPSTSGAATSSYQIAIGASATCSGGSAIAIGSSASAAANCMDIRFGGSSRVSGDANGQIGINEATPGAQLQVTSGAAARKGLIVKQAASATANPLEVQDSSGNVLFGVKSDGSTLFNTSTKVTVNTVKQATDGYGSGFSFVRAGASGGYWEIVHGGDNNLYIGYGGGNRAVIYESSGNYGALSDERMKKNIEDNDLGLDTVLSLRPVKYHMVSEDDTAVKHIGFIAQEVNPHVPSSIQSMMDGTLAMDRSELIGILVKAVQELNAKVQQQEQRIAALEAMAR